LISAIIGGTGVYGLSENVVEKDVITKYGTVRVELVNMGDNQIVFLPRHGKHHNTPPHLINYKANMTALKILGVSHILATCAVGSCNDDFEPGDIIEIVDFLDFTKNRQLTLHDEGDSVKHTGMSEPYCSRLRFLFEESTKENRVQIKGRGVYVCTEGPRFESAAEIKFYKHIGGDVVGMTNVPEVVMAKELGMCYAAYCIVTNWCTGMKNEIVIHNIQAALLQNKDKLTKAFIGLLDQEHDQEHCNCDKSVLEL